MSVVPETAVPGVSPAFDVAKIRDRPGNGADAARPTGAEPAAA